MNSFLLALVVLSKTLTPGALAVDLHGKPLTTEFVCSTKWSTVPRTLTDKDKAHVYDLYHVPPSERAKYVIDHLISLMLGGSERDYRNTFPQEKQESYRKDAIERQLFAMVCGRHPWTRQVMTLQDAQRRIASDWKHAAVLTTVLPTFQ